MFMHDLFKFMFFACLFCFLRTIASILHFLQTEIILQQCKFTLLFQSQTVRSVTLNDVLRNDGVSSFAADIS